MSEKGFEDFTKAERGVGAKLKRKVLEAINKFLGSLKLPKWVKLGDNELRYMLWRYHERLGSKDSTPDKLSAMDYVDMARDAAKREELGLRRNEVTRERRITDENPTKKDVANINEARLNDLHPADGDHAAKVAHKLETAKSALTQIAQSYKTRKGVSQRAMLLKESSTLTSATDGATLSDGTKSQKFLLRLMILR